MWGNKIHRQGIWGRMNGNELLQVSRNRSSGKLDLFCSSWGKGRLEDLLRERSELLRARDAAEHSREAERERRERLEMQSGLARAELEGSVAELRERLTRTKERVEELEKERQVRRKGPHWGRRRGGAAL